MTSITQRHLASHETCTLESPCFNRSITVKQKDPANTKECSALSICMSQIYSLPTEMSDLFTQIAGTGRLTMADCNELLVSLSDTSLSQEDRQLADRILYGLRRGWLAVDRDCSFSN